jgi:hypothetical protein
MLDGRPFFDPACVFHNTTTKKLPSSAGFESVDPVNTIWAMDSQKLSSDFDRPRSISRLKDIGSFAFGCFFWLVLTHISPFVT